jgi:dUTP pyrophosphatase
MRGVRVENGLLLMQAVDKNGIKPIKPEDIEAFCASGMMGTVIDFKDGSWDIFSCFPCEVTEALEKISGQKGKWIMNIDGLEYKIGLLEKRIEELEKRGKRRIPVPIKRLHPKALIPRYQKDGDAGFDFHALIDNEIGYVVVEPHSQVIVPTGLACAIPVGHEIQVRPRSGLSFKYQITVTNSPGTLDSPYRGEIKVIIYNLSNEPFSIKNEDRIAQGVLGEVEEAMFFLVDDLSLTDRGAGGFGSTGI